MKSASRSPPEFGIPTAASLRNTKTENIDRQTDNQTHIARHADRQKNEFPGRPALEHRARIRNNRLGFRGNQTGRQQRQTDGQPGTDGQPCRSTGESDTRIPLFLEYRKQDPGPDFESTVCIG